MIDGRTVEMLTVEQFAERMQISKSTVSGWIRNKRLQRGRHFIQIDKIIRLPWRAELVDLLLEDSLKQFPETADSGTAEAYEKRRRCSASEKTVVQLSRRPEGQARPKHPAVASPTKRSSGNQGRSTCPIDPGYFDKVRKAG